MPRPQNQYTFTNADLAEMSGWPEDRVRQDITNGSLVPDNLASVVVWAASNAKWHTRGKMFAPLLRAFLGVDGRGTGAQKRLGELANQEILRLVFEDDDRLRKARAKLKGDRPSLTSRRRAAKRGE